MRVCPCQHPSTQKVGEADRDVAKYNGGLRWTYKTQEGHLYITALTALYVCVLGPRLTRTAHRRRTNRPKAETQPSGATPNTPPPPAAQLALASPLIPDTLKRLQEGVLTLTFPCESGGGMETV